MQSILRQSMRCLQSAGLTLCEMPEFLTNIKLRNALVARSKDPDVIKFFDYLGRQTKSTQDAYIESSRSRCDDFVGNDYLGPIFGQRESTINFDELINTPGKIFVVNASEAHLHDEPRFLFTALLIAKIHAAILRRDSIPEENRVPLFLLIDESHECYYRPGFQSILVGGRKYRAAMMMFVQSLSQFIEHGKQDVDVNIVLGNCATKSVFQVESSDALRFSKDLVFPFTGNIVKEKPQGKARRTYWSMAQEYENVLHGLMTQSPGQNMLEIKDGRSTEPYFSEPGYIDYHRSSTREVKELVSTCSPGRPGKIVEQESSERIQRITGASAAQKTFDDESHEFSDDPDDEEDDRYV